ncbi:peptidylprolyl isomerase [Leptolyngbya ohadii]|uniref:peptidylprolyl isomerase n=1 Tax=Leptolyngbya ohadii TaxID=1962290 RepID=UPI000B59F5D7|nr:peptidylprolyl isomerase [Leptolyngbya ohadii]
MALVVTPIADQVVKTTDTTTLNLFSAFDDPRTTGLVARFELYNPALGGGVTNVVLFDQAGAGAPQTVQNFRNYINDGDYANTIIHRSVPGFVVQGGGFTANGLAAALAQTPPNPPAAIGVIPTDPPVVNEFSPGRSNVRGTIAMAKLGTNPNSATSQWFFNLANNNDPTNPLSLDNQNGGFTVFGQVMSTADLAPLDAIAALPRFNGSSFFNQGAFGELPLQGVNPQTPIAGDENFVRYRNITVSQQSELQFSVVKNTNPDLVTASIVNNQLVMSYRSAAAQTAEITIRATNLLGESTEDTFVVTLSDGTSNPPGTPNPVPVPSPVPNNQPTEGNDRLLGTNANDVIAGLGGNDQINGGNGNDRLSGGAGSDRLAGDAGNDWLDGGAGRDRLVTGKGRDVIVIGRGDGFDVVQDFADRRDKIKLEDGLSFGQLSVRQRGDDTLLRIGGTRVLLENVAATAIGQADFR